MVIRRRYYFWLLKAYFRRWYKTILASTVIGAAIFFFSIFFFKFYLIPLFEKKVQKIGYWGIYTTSTVPEAVFTDVSFGLTRVLGDGSIVGSAAESWRVADGGKTYIFSLKKGLYFHTGEEFTSDNLPLHFKDVTRKKIDTHTVSYHLKAPYSPFLTSVSKPIFLANSHGLGEYKIKKFDMNAGFVRYIQLQHTKDSRMKKVIYFYATEQALKKAFALGEIDIAYNLSDLLIKDSRFDTWKGVSVQKNIDYKELVVVFYNNNHKVLSNKKLRQALTYALPNLFSQGERSYSSIPPTSIYFSEPPNYGITDIEIARDLLTSIGLSKKEKQFELLTFEEYKNTAKQVQDAWQKIGIEVKIKVTDTLPDDFQIFVYRFKLPKDPDQYAIWHSGQVNNIMQYKNIRIDKLLEDGRLTTDVTKRKNIYADFQKYLIDDAPSSFLYFPYQYTVRRK